MAGPTQSSGFVLTLVFLIQGCCSQDFQCGVANSNTRIVGGQDAMPDSWPWQASVYIGGSFTCGGSLINDLWVMTAAHCITRMDLASTKVRLGVHDRTGSNPNEVTRDLEDIVCHPDYDSSTLDNDICLLKLAESVKFSDAVTPICLPTEASTFHTNTSCWVTGFGTTDSGSLADVLQEVNVPIVGNNKCECYYEYDITDNMVCAGLKAGGKDSCQGDSGGPMMTKQDDGSWVQVGVVSFGEGCGLPMKPGVYARVSQYEDWITEQVGSANITFVNFMSAGQDPDDNFVCSITRPTTTYRPPYTTYRPPYTTYWPPYTTYRPPYTTYWTQYTTYWTQYTTYRPPIPTDDSIFGGAENLMHFTQVLSACVFGLLVVAAI